MNDKIEQQKNNEKKQESSETLYKLVASQGFDFKKTVPYLAESFNVCTKEEYNRALKHSNKKNIEYNLAIREKLLHGAKIESEIDESVLKYFSIDRQNFLKKNFGPGTEYSGFVGYLNGLTEDQKKQLKEDMSDDQFYAFCIQQSRNLKKINATKGSEKIDNSTFEQIKNIGGLEKFEEEFNEFKNHPVFKDLAWTPAKQVDIWYRNLSPEEKKQLLEKNENNEEKVKKFMELSANIKLASESGLVQKLDAAQQAEFNKMMTEYYIYNESIGLGEQLKEIWGELYDKVKNMVVMYVETAPASPMDKMKNDIIQNKNVKKYFTDNMKDELVSEAKKSDQYYQGLRKLYPELDKIIERDPKIQELIEKKDPTEEEKKELKQMLQEKTKSSGVENELLKETRSVVQEQAITTCLDMLTSYMDIDLNEQENVLDQFADVEHTIDADEENKNVVLQINGKINGKNLKLYYNLTTGTLQQEEFLSRGAINTPFAINDPINGKQDISGIQLPKFKDFITAADPESMDYSKCIQDAENMDDYKKKVASTLKQTVKKEGVWDMNTEKIMFEKNIMKNLAAQEVFLFMEQNINESAKTFSPINNKEVYDMYTLIYMSLEVYTLDEMKTFRKNIATLDQNKHKYMQYTQQKDVNKEKYILGYLGQEDVSHTENKKQEKQDGDTNSEYAYLKNYANFFAIFKDTTYTLPIIDPMIFDKFTYHVGLEVSNNQEYITKDDMKRNFNEFAERGNLPSLDEAFV